VKSKKNGEFAHLFVTGIVEECTKKEDERDELDKKLELAVKNIIYQTTVELMGGDADQMEKKLKKAVSIHSH